MYVNTLVKEYTKSCMHTIILTLLHEMWTIIRNKELSYESQWALQILY